MIEIHVGFRGFPNAFAVTAFAGQHLFAFEAMWLIVFMAAATKLVLAEINPQPLPIAGFVAVGARRGYVFASQRPPREVMVELGFAAGNGAPAHEIVVRAFVFEVA